MGFLYVEARLRRQHSSHLPSRCGGADLTLIKSNVNTLHIAPILHGLGVTLRIPEPTLRII